jgi:hypothetical protein
MMAVDSKLGETKLGVVATNGANGAAVNGTQPNGAPTALPGQVAEGTKRTKRTSSLMKSASSLPKVEHSLDEFIARANQTLVDVSNWGTADQQAREQDEKRREVDALRWKQAESQMRESEVRESTLRRQLDGLQGKLAEAEARAAVAGTQMGSAAHDTKIEALRAEIEQAAQRMRVSEQRSQELSKALEVAKTEVAARPVFAIEPDDNDAEERIRHAEAKAAKALAAARAAAAGLTVSSADLAAIESGLVVPLQAERRTPWIAIMLAFAGGLGIMFLVWKFALSNNGKDAPKVETSATPTAQPAVQAAPPPAPAAPVKPTVTPIDDGTQPAAATDNSKKPGPTVTPIEPEVKPEVKAETKPAPEPEIKPEPKPVVKKAVTRPAVRTTPTPAAKTQPAKKTPGKPAGGIADPFADPTPAKKAPPAKKDKGAIVDPFGG